MATFGFEWEPQGEAEQELADIVSHGVDAVCAVYRLAPGPGMRELIGSALLTGVDMGIVLAQEDAHAAGAAQASLMDQELFTDEVKSARVALFARYRMLVPR
jgi:hypothetical protein